MPKILSDDNPLPNQFEMGEIILTQLVLRTRDTRTCACINGNPGLGKTFLVNRVLKQTGLTGVFVKGTGPGLLLTAYRERRGIHPIILDDADSMAFGGTLMHRNLMKSLLDPVRRRLILNQTVKAFENEKKRIPNPAIPPSKFYCEAVFIIVTNATKHELSKDNHARALFDRGLAPIELSDSRQFALEWVLHLIVNEGLVDKERLSIAELQEVVNWLCDNQWRVEQITIRLAEQCAAWRRDEPQNWRRLMAAQYLLPYEIGDGDNYMVPTPQIVAPPRRPPLVVPPPVVTEPTPQKAIAAPVDKPVASVDETNGNQPKAA